MIALLVLAAVQAIQPPVVSRISGIAVQSSLATADCRSGLVERSFGGQEWHVFACSDQSLLLIAPKSNPAYPYLLRIKAGKPKAEISIGEVFAYRPLPRKMRDEMENLDEAMAAWLHAQSMSTKASAANH